MLRVYLAGPINGCTDDQANGWRSRMRELLGPGVKILDPMARDYRGREDESVQAIVEGDKNDICASDAVVVNAERASWGTAMEVVLACMWRKRVIVVVPPGRPVSPWLRYHATTVVESFEAAANALR